VRLIYVVMLILLSLLVSIEEENAAKPSSKHTINTKYITCSNIIILMVMKRIEAFITSEKTSAVLSALEDRGFQATFYESKGMGKGEKYTISYAKGGGTQKMTYSTRSIVVSIVDENKVKETVSAIKEAAKTGTTSAGIVVVSSIDDVV